MRRKIVAGNWKMNLTKDSAEELVTEISRTNTTTGVELMVFPPFVFIDAICHQELKGIKVGAQDFYFEHSGAFTGEVSLDQLKSVGAEIVLIGHSERRELFNESNAMLKHKVNAAISTKMPFIFCCGEPLNIRKTGREFEYVKFQLEESLFHLSKSEISNAIIAYEPIWAIGTGETARSDQAEEMHAAIRGWLEQQYDAETANSIALLYGGSCKPDNAKELFACKNVDGGLIGGASLNASDFLKIANSF